MVDRAETIQLGSKTVRKFHPVDRPIRDGTVRCLACGQIDEDGYHDNRLCPATQGRGHVQ